MKRISTLYLFIALLLGCQQNNQTSSKQEPEPIGVDNVAYKWGKMALKATANDTEKFRPRPTITSRYLGLIFVSVFDAWSRYDEKATPVYLSGVQRRPADEQTLKNKEVAISYAAFRAMNEYYFSDETMFRDFMKELGLDPDNESMDATTPEGIGNLAAKAVIEARKGDGANQYAEEAGSDGQPYYDYTGYAPVNPVDKNVDPNRWQPKYFSDGKGGKYAPGCLTPFWDKVKPVALKSGDQFRPGPPPMVGSEQLEKEVWEVIDMQANLTDEQKALVEFMRDGPQSVQQAGHWLKFAQDVSVRDNHTLDQDVKMYFYNQVVAMDAFIASWDSKIFYDYARPYALVHQYYDDQKIKAWGGEGKGMIEMTGNQWRPYSPETFLCPPFPSYVSGHSTISGGCAEALKLWTGSDEFGSESVLVAGAMTEPDNLGDTITLRFPTFTQTAEMAGISRVLGGYHIQSDNIEGLKLGRDVAREAWKFYKMHVGED
ncbi:MULTISPECIES: vanadium-dependent haloperoxidase [unclassified Imperialibacter]|uniref:vanadium-dependent haloperoxidase n=1 Tax=unclassified Imperialibacter TaxID=2629706 RepID=UPI0012570DD7|nr:MULTISPECIES: vanadium-dependent haloperoxidase [unclassified Imperialibacter]CAD5275837.1 Haloperoxidase [Imperialibacter sp. 75]CAD5293873.1 Haloperoxidase [Imperialibacter sp. 89]VVT12767.1 Haloperoxidase [Imperialibacter sp. EC-SDR9]